MIYRGVELLLPGIIIVAPMMPGAFLSSAKYRLANHRSPSHDRALCFWRLPILIRFEDCSSHTPKLIST
jgi:hypothetical protein